MAAAVVALLAAACSGPDRNELGVYVDEEFTAMYMPDSGGVTSADGTISFTLSDGSSIFMTGDCFTGDVTDNARDHADRMINNAFVHVSPDGKYLGSIYGGKVGDPRSLLVPAEADTSSRAFWYWPAHAYVADGTIHTVMTKFYQGGEGQWGFRFAGTDLILQDESDFSVKSVTEIFPRTTAEHWGHSILADTDFVYFYGTRGWGDLCVYRTTASAPTCAEFFTGSGWEAEGAPAKLEGLTVPVSEQFSVFRYKDKYVLITMSRIAQDGGIWSFVADSPEGPWSNGKLLYTTTEQTRDKNLFTYNAMAHPQYINSRGELLICYNVNSYDQGQILDEVDTYRPVFLRVPMKSILY